MIYKMAFTFDINEYMGVWYELIHYPSWFQRNDGYNTKAEYQLKCDGTVSVHNSSISRGRQFDSYGTAKNMGGVDFRVDFPMSEISKLTQSGEYKSIQSGEFNPGNMKKSNNINYVIDHLWVDQHGKYLFAVVTDPAKHSLYVLSRHKHPPLKAYNIIMDYVVTHYDRDRLIQTPQFD
jgi:lipocalin